MPTRWSQTLIPTLRQAPSDAEVPSHQLMLRAGLIRKLGSGSYSYLPLGCRSLRKAAQIVREEMDRSGAAEVSMPALQPIDLWERTGRREAYGENLFVVEDRHGRESALGPTHEEVVTELVGASLNSYKDLPKVVYQIQTKFRDEFRPRFGVLRSREFLMKDAYSFHLTLDSLDATYEAQRQAYCRILERCGLPYAEVEAQAGEIGGNASQEFMIPAPTGEDTILTSDKGNYAANVEKAATAPRPFDLNAAPLGELEQVHTPNVPSIDEVCAFFKKQFGSKLKPASMLKTLVLSAEDGGWVVAVVRGDHELNTEKLKEALGGRKVALAEEAPARAAGFAIGFVGPHVALGRQDITLVADYDALQGGFWVTGANQADHHVKCFAWQRDLLAAGVTVLPADIRNAQEGDPSPLGDGGVLRETKGIEAGHIFKLGTKYTQALDVTVTDENNQPAAVLMGCYGIGVNRLLAGAIERAGGNDADGIIWPKALAPYQVVITALRYEAGNVVQKATDALAAELKAAGVDVLIDDRDERPGVKFKDADLIGFPLRITIGEKGLAEGQIEIKARNGSNGAKGESVAASDATRRAVALLETL